MSKNRNRTIKLPIFPNHSLPYLENDRYFGDKITEETSPSTIHLSSSSSIDSVILSINNVGSSSSSIVSWGEDNNGTKRVQEELQRMDRIFAGEEAIPPHYDWEEYKEWMELFPNLRILRRQGEDEASEDEDVTLLADDCDNSVLATSVNKPKAVINRLKTNLVKQGEIVINNLHLDIDNYLKISPINQYYNYNVKKEARLTERQKSSKSKITSGLPLQNSEFLTDSNNRLNSGRSTQNSALSRLRRKNVIVLPPIEGSQCRSISATPRTLNRTSFRRDDFKYSFRSGSRKLQE